MELGFTFEEETVDKRQRQKADSLESGEKKFITRHKPALSEYEDVVVRKNQRADNQLRGELAQISKAKMVISREIAKSTSQLREKLRKARFRCEHTQSHPQARKGIHRKFVDPKLILRQKWVESKRKTDVEENSYFCGANFRSLEKAPSSGECRSSRPSFLPPLDR